MAIASAVKSQASSANTKKYKAGKTPTHTLSVCKNPNVADKTQRVFVDLGFLFPTKFGTDMDALGGAEILPRVEGEELKKNPLRKYFITKDKEGNVVLLRIEKDPIYLNDGETLDKEALEGAKGKIVRVAKMEPAQNSERIAFTGESEEGKFYANHWSPKK